MLYTGVMDKTIYMLWFFFLITGLAVLWSNFSSDSEFTNIISTYSSQACLWGNTINVIGYHKHFHFIHSGYVKCIHYVVFSFSAKESCKNNDIEVVKIWRYKKNSFVFYYKLQNTFTWTHISFVIIFQLGNRLKYFDPQKLHTAEDEDPDWLQHLSRINAGFQVIFLFNPFLLGH